MCSSRRVVILPLQKRVPENALQNLPFQPVKALFKTLQQTSVSVAELGMMPLPEGTTNRTKLARLENRLLPRA
jgi:hypothetical protein